MSEPLFIQVESADLPEPYNTLHCKAGGCTCRVGYLARYIKADASVAVRWVCEWCEDYKTAGDLPRSFLPPDVTVEQLPVRLDRSHEQRDMPRCAVCGNDGEDFHHWAPQSIFPEWPGNVGVALCKYHHRLWHARMREHGLRWPHELANAT